MTQVFTRYGSNDAFLGLFAEFWIKMFDGLKINSLRIQKSKFSWPMGRILKLWFYVNNGPEAEVPVTVRCGI